MNGMAVCLTLLVAGAATGATDRIALGDAAYARFDNQAALTRYLEAARLEPSNPEALWKTARAYSDVGKALETRDQGKAKEQYELGERLARRAVAAAPDLADAHFVLAVCVGRLALFEGGKSKIRLSKEVKREAERAIALDPRHDGAYLVLGLWHYNIATLSWLLKAFAKVIYGGVPPGASLETAALMFAKAVEIDGARPLHRLEYGRTLIRLGRTQEAREQLRKCLELKPVQWDDAANQAEAKELLRQLER